MSYISISLSESSVNVVNNTSVVTARVYLYITNGQSWNGNSQPGSIYINGSYYSFSSSFGSGSGAQLIGVASRTITHNSDGTGSVSVSASFNTGVSLGTLSNSNSMTLTTIPRASDASLSSTTPDYGSDITISIDRKSSAFTHQVHIGNSNLDWVQIGSGITTSLTYAVPKSYAQYIKSATDSFTIRLITYNGATRIGTKDYTIYPKLTSDMLPTVSIVDSDPTGLANIYGGYVVGQSKIQIDLIETPYENAAITSRTVAVNGESLSDNPCCSKLVTGTSNLIKATVIDARGGKTVQNKAITVLDWFAPAVNVFKVERCNASGTAQADGTYIKVTYAIDIAHVANKNRVSMSIKYKTSNTTVWSSRIVATEGANYSLVGTEVLGISVSDSWNIKLEVGDKFKTIESYLITIGTGFDLLNFHNDGTGACFGGYAELSNTVDFKLYANFQKGTSYDDKLIVKQSVSITSSSAVSDSKYDAKGYPYHIDIPITGCTANHMPEVMPTETAAEVMFYRCETLAGAVRVYVKNNSFGTVTLSTIKCSKNFKEV